MSFPIKFSLREKELMINLLSIEPEIVDRLNLAIIENNSVTITFDIDELDLLIGAIAADANHTESNKLRKEFNTLFNRVDKIYRTKM